MEDEAAVARACTACEKPMRINVYSQELTGEVKLLSKASDGRVTTTSPDLEEPVIYHAAQLMLHSSPMLHHPPQDDDRSAVTFWLPKSTARREELAKAFDRIANIFRSAPESGLD
jgi:hypothetical protein